MTHQAPARSSFMYPWPFKWHVSQSGEPLFARVKACALARVTLLGGSISSGNSINFDNLSAYSHHSWSDKIAAGCRGGPHPRPNTRGTLYIVLLHQRRASNMQRTNGSPQHCWILKSGKHTVKCGDDFLSFYNRLPNSLMFYKWTGEGQSVRLPKKYFNSQNNGMMIIMFTI